ncbi:hypothetical protein PENARI_c010G05170 [Penicillium arizonense]|uniref:Heme haloperoxidase family profile domain-containing protein n=1 Tax=Penicillium arizonense TaxID=1835702 RepID=A0A1F5LH79_PENAI|nr:hypothetical protein PENARI_c010G05170 [Penicillium arizonense]OGE52573.1 hypothetical protein PENARI_c010G05170 [Penicillium arizonense]
MISVVLVPASMSSPTTDIMIGVQCKISMILKSLRLMITRSGVVSSPEGAIGPNEAYGLALRLGGLLPDGDVTTLRTDTFKALYDLANDDGVPNYNLDVLTKHRQYTLNLSKENNPYFFSVLFAGVAVSNAVHTFILTPRNTPTASWIKKPSNHFFSIKEDENGTLIYIPGYDTPGNITGGAYNIFGLLNPKGRSCFFYQLILAVVSDFLRSRLLRDVLGPALNLLSDKLNQFIDPERAKIGKFDLKTNINDSFAAQFPGVTLANQ